MYLSATLQDGEEGAEVLDLSIIYRRTSTINSVLSTTTKCNVTTSLVVYSVQIWLKTCNIVLHVADDCTACLFDWICAVLWTPALSTFTVTESTQCASPWTSRYHESRGPWPYCRTKLVRRRFSVAAPRVWNSLPVWLTTHYDSLRAFKNNLKTFLYRRDIT